MTLFTFVLCAADDAAYNVFFARPMTLFIFVLW